jgi:hypothetical protein
MPLLGDTASGRSGPSIWWRVLYPHSPSCLVARLSATHKRAQTVSGPPQSPTRSLEVSGSQTDPMTPWYNGRAGIRESEREKRVRERESACAWLYAGVDWGVRSWVQGSARKRGEIARNLKVMGCCCYLRCVGRVKGERGRKYVTDTNKIVNLLFPRRIFSSKTQKRDRSCEGAQKQNRREKKDTSTNQIPGTSKKSIPTIYMYL